MTEYRFNLENIENNQIEDKINKNNSIDGIENEKNE